MKQKHRLLVLFLKTLYISAFTFGGGFVIVTFMKKCFVDELQWIDEQEMLDFTALAQSCPGAIAVNGAILVGNASRRGGCDSGCFLWAGSECSEGKKAVFNCNHGNCVPG